MRPQSLQTVSNSDQGQARLAAWWGIKTGFRRTEGMRLLDREQRGTRRLRSQLDGAKAEETSGDER